MNSALVLCVLVSIVAITNGKSECPSCIAAVCIVICMQALTTVFD